MLTTFKLKEREREREDHGVEDNDHLPLKEQQLLVSCYADMTTYKTTPTGHAHYELNEVNNEH